MKDKKLIKDFLVVGIIILVSIIFMGNNKLYALEDVENYTELYKQYLELSDEEKAKVNVIPEKYGISLKEYNEKNKKFSK